MSKHVVLRASLMATIFISTLSAASPNAFIGKWVWQSNVKGGGFAIKQTSPGKYDLTSINGTTENHIADGVFRQSSVNASQQISLEVSTDEKQLTLKEKGSGKFRDTVFMQVSTDGKTLKELETGVNPKGERTKSESLFTRAKPDGTNVEGEWIFSKLTIIEGPQYIMTVTSDGPNQITISNNWSDSVSSVNSLDGKPYKDSDNGTTKGASGIKMIDDHTLTNLSFRDNVLYSTGTWTVSPDGKTLTDAETPKKGAPFTMSYLRQ